VTETLVVPQGTFELTRHPLSSDAHRRAWDAADEYVLHHLAEVGLTPGSPVLVLNGGQGALAVALAATHEVTVVSDSFVDHVGTRANLATNDRAVSAVVDPVSAAEVVEPGSVGLLVVKVPKSTALLEEELRMLRPLLRPDAAVVGAGMTRHVHTSTIDAFTGALGPTTTSLARKKARLLHSTLDPSVVPPPSAWPRTRTVRPGLTLVHHAGVFSAAHLDAGAALLLDHLPDVSVADGGAEVVDLGCGNGVLGVAVLAADATARVTFVDESFAAVASARASVSASLGDEALDRARFVVGDGLELAVDGRPVAAGSVDLVLDNPPFHDDHALGDAVAWQMFTEAYRALRPGGELRVVGNRHLGYHLKLRRIFGNCEVVASDPKFVVLSATRPVS